MLTLPGHLMHEKSYPSFNTSVTWVDSPQLILFFRVCVSPPNHKVLHGLWLTGAVGGGRADPDGPRNIR